MATIDIEKLKNALLEGKEEAKKYITIKDGGACNFDSPTLRVERKSKKIENAIIDCGLNFFKSDLHGYVICGGTSGQADRRSKMAEAISQTLKNNGFTAGMYYQMD